MMNTEEPTRLNHRPLRLGLAAASSVLLFLALLALLGATAGSATTVTPLVIHQETGELSNGPVITIGVAAALGGPDSMTSIGWGEANSAQLAVSRTNAAGGVDIGGVTYTLALATVDSACSETQAITAANTLLDAGAVAVVGHTCSGASLAAQPLYSAAGVPMISPSASFPQLTQQGYTNTFRTIPNESTAPTVLATHFRKRMGLSRSAIVQRPEQRFDWIADAYENTFTGLGGTITSRSVATDTSDFPAVLTAIRAESPDAIFYTDPDPVRAGEFSSTAYGLGMTDVVIGWYSTLYYPSLLDTYASTAGTAAAEDDFYAIHGRRLEDMPGWATFLADYQAAGFPNEPDTPSPFGAHAYDAANIIIAAIDRADSTDPDAIRDEIAATANYEGVVGTYAGFDAKGDVIPQWAWLARYQSGQWVTEYPVAVGLILDGPTVDDMSFNWFSYQGLLRAQSELGVVGTVYTSTSSADYVPNLQQCVDDGNDLCISVGFLMGDATLGAAEAHTDTYFATVDFAWEDYPDNLRGMIFAEDEAGYLAGTLAGLMTQSDVVGDIGGVQIPPVERYVEGYRNGAQCANPDATVLVNYTGEFGDPDLGAQVAQDMIAQGADVIFAPAGSLGVGAVKSATQSGVWGIGVDTDFYVTAFENGAVAGSDKLLSSAMKRLDNAVFETIADVISGTFTSGTVRYDLAAEGVGLAPFHATDPFVTQSIRDEVGRVKQSITREAIDVNGPCPQTPAQAFDAYTLNYNLQTEPPALDPAKAIDTTSTSVIEQLFLGLVDIDDRASEVRAELASSWTTSPDGTVYTFTLRSDVTWTDGTPVTAQDARYGILRTLDPATGSAAASLLYLIENAEAYHTGAITDTNQVGVTAMDDTHLRITLERPASYALSILALSVARPMPQQAIEMWEDVWTEPGHIVTNGPYRLTEWVHGDHILLEKNPTYYGADTVQIDRVEMWMVDTPTAWQMYLNDKLDTTGVPFDQLEAVRSDPILSQELYTAPIPCTYYYGFNVSQPPFDNPLVRKAFAAAVDRPGLVAGSIQQPALTFTPPGVFGHVDGYAEDVGIPYNPTRAQQWLSDAGYPDGVGLPEITLWYNEGTGHQAIAEYVRDNWYTTLGVSVTLQSLPWSDYLDQMADGEFQIWRLAWCADYNDAYNFLYDGVAARNPIYGGWTNATYDNLLNQAAQEQKLDVRGALYKQAEEILVASEAVMIPLYYYSSMAVAKPYLERTYGPGGFDIATWRITRVSSAVGTAGGRLASYDSRITLEIPAGAITDTVVITHTPACGVPPGGSLTSVGHVFDVTAVYSSTGVPAQPVPGQTYTATVRYTDAEQGPAIENTLTFYGWNGSAWSQKGITSSVDAANNIVTAQVDHFSRFTIAGLVCYDFDGDMQVSIGDVQAVANRWHQAVGTPYDLDSDGTVTVADIMEVVANWGETCSTASSTS